MKLAIFIPCYNEQEIIGLTLENLPKTIPGISKIYTIIINDGSTDQTAAIAQQYGVDQIIHIEKNTGLANAFRKGIHAGLEMGADIIAHTDADNQYCGEDLSKIVEPILQKKADLVVGERPIESTADFSWIKKKLQRLGSFVVRQLSGTNVVDAPSGFRAYSKETAMQLNIFSDFTYTAESLIQAGVLGLNVLSVKIRTNPVQRPSRLAKNTLSFIWRSASSIIQMYIFYQPRVLFYSLALILGLPGMGLCLRFLFFYFVYNGKGHIQSLILSTILILLSALCFLLGIIMGFLSNNRLMLEEIQYRLRKLTLSTKND